MKKILTTAIAASLVAAVPALADTVKVGYMTTLSGGAGIIGKQMQNGVNLGSILTTAAIHQGSILTTAAIHQGSILPTAAIHQRSILATAAIHQRHSVR